ncbi:MAG: hypothetical protein ABH842_02280 [Candidatus Micrarchaeota archaeon]
MLPPVCKICNKEFYPEKDGDLVYFLVRKKTILERLLSLFERKNICCHPENAVWFCNKHLKKAKSIALTHTIEEGMAILGKSKRS